MCEVESSSLSAGGKKKNMEKVEWSGLCLVLGVLCVEWRWLFGAGRERGRERGGEERKGNGYTDRFRLW